MRHFVSVLSTASAATVALFSFSAAAHIHLIDPAPRYAEANKSCPCGDGDSNRRCQQTAEESTDPNRSSNVTTLEAGSTITVTAEEYIDHEGRMRVAFDPDGADLADFNDNILLDESDPAEAGLSASSPRVWEFEVTVPDETCENCTLQVIQVMNNDPVNKVMDPAPLSTYYSCADIRIVPAGSMGQENDPPEGGGGAGGSAMVAANGNGGRALPSGSSGSRSVDNEPANPSDVDSDDSTCAFSPGHVPASSPWALVALGALALRRRRR